MFDTVSGGSVSAYYQRSASGVTAGGKNWLAGGTAPSIRGGDGAIGETLSSGGTSFAKIIGKLMIEADQRTQS